MREIISGVWHLLDGWERIAIGLFMASALITLGNLITEPGWDTALNFAGAVLIFVTVTGLIVTTALYKQRLKQELSFRPLTRFGVDIIKEIEASENRSVMVHSVGGSYMIEQVGVEDEHE